MDSSGAPEGGGGDEMANAILTKFRDPRTSHEITFYTSGSMHRHLTGGQMLRPGEEKCQTHELILIPTQSGPSPHNPDIEYVSCICNSCRHRFHFTVTNTSKVPFEQNHPCGMHMYGQDLARKSEKAAKNAKNAKSTLGSQDLIMDKVQLVCVVDGCHCKVELERLPARLSLSELKDLGDKDRPVRNLRKVSAKDPRYSDMTADSVRMKDVFDTFLRYISDGIKRDPSLDPLKVKRRNKTFEVYFSDDFDVLLRNLGFEFKVLDDGDEAWVFPKLEPVLRLTPFGSRRAKWEDLEAELMLHSQSTGERRMTPAWEQLQRLFRSDYDGVNNPPTLSVNDMVLLGCLDSYKPRLFVQAAKFLADKCPSRREEFLHAAERSLPKTGDGEALEMEIVTYRSRFDDPAVGMVATVSDVSAAFAFFNTSSSNRDIGYFVNKYLELLEADPSDQGRAQLTQHSQVVDNILNTRIEKLARQRMSDNEAELTNAPKIMDLDKAQQILAPATLDCDAELLQSVVNRLVQRPDVHWGDVKAALETFAAWNKQGNPSAAEECIRLSKSLSSDVQPSPSLNAEVPPGLRNIGNTCYLNSLLQYLYTVVAIRKLALEYPQNSLDLSQRSIEQRQLGFGNGISVNLDEAIVGRQFMEEMQSFFKRVATTTELATQPSQKLANTALRSASELLKKFVDKSEQQDSKPPPLPARPSPTPPNSAPTTGDAVDTAMESQLDSAETASVVSSQTLVNDEEGNSTGSFVQLGTTEKGVTEKEGGNDTKPPAADAAVVTNEAFPKNKTQLIAECLEQSDRKGTDQQDVEEIIGFILEHVMRAIRSSGPMPGKPDLQADIITDTFFPLIVNYTEKSKGRGAVKESRAEVTTDRWINAFPHPKNGVSSTIQEALHRSFDLQTVEGQMDDENTIVRYSAIRRLSPIIHIRIQRANATRAGASKNKNPVVLNDTLLLDPFMDTPDDSKLGIARRVGWAVGGHDADDEEMEVDNAPKNVAITQDQDATTQDQDATPMDIDMKLSQWKTGEEAVDGVFGGMCSPDSVLPRKRKFGDGHADAENVPPSTAERPGTPSDTSSETGGITPSLSEASLPEIETAVETAITADATLEMQKYRLHAVICHSGGTAAGHYWVWIRDFERDVWIKFNDERVTVDTREPQAVLDELNKGGDPCYLAYVREEGKENLVNIPKRAMPNPNDADMGATDVDMQTIEGISPSDAAAKADAPFSGLSDAEPRAYDLL